MATSPIVPLPPGFQLDKPATPAVEAQPPAGFVLDRSVAEQAKNAVQLTTPVGVAMRALELVPGVKAVTTPIKEGLYEGTIGAMRSAAGTVEAAGKVLGGTGSLGAALAPAKEAQAAVRPGPSLQDVWEGKGSAKDFLLQGTTSSLPSMIATLGGGAMAGPAGAGAVSYLLNAGDVYNDLRDKGIDAPGAALAAGIPITALDMIEPLRLLAKTRNMAVSKLVREGLGRTILKDVAAEALPEGAQQVIQDLTVMGQEGKGYDKRQLLWSAANAAVLGGLTGGVAGSVAHVATGRDYGASYGGSPGESTAPAPTVQAPEGILPSPVPGPWEPAAAVPAVEPTLQEAAAPVSVPPMTVEPSPTPTSPMEVKPSAETQAVASLPAVAPETVAAGTLPIEFEPIDVDAARQSPMVAFGLDTTDAGSLGASLGSAVLQARANPQARARLSLAAAEAIERGFDGAEIAATAAEAAHQLDPTASPAEITAAVQPFVSLIPSDAEQVQRAVETMRSVLIPEQVAPVVDYAGNAREAKAKKLADLLYDHGIASADVESVPAEMWPQLAKLAGVNVPSADTRALVQRLVRLKETSEQSTLGANPVSAVVRSAARYMRRRQGLQRTVPAALRKQLAIGSAFNRKMLTMRQLGWQAPSFYPLQHRIKTVDAMNRLQNYIKIKGEETLKLWQRLSEKHRVQLTKFALTAHEQSVQLGRRLTIAELDAIDPTLTPAQQATYDATDKYVQSTARSLDNALQRRVAAQGATSATGSQLSKVQNENFFPTVGFGPWLVHDLTTDQYYRTDTEAEQKGKKYALEASGHKVGLDKLTRDELAFASVPHKMIPDLIKNLPLPEKARVKLAKLAYKDVSGQATSAYDSERALAQFAQRMGNFIARAYHREDLHRSTDMAREVGDQEVLAGQDATSTRAMQEWLNDHAKDVLNPESSYQAVKSLLFLKFFWANAKQAAINLTQIPLNTFPVLSTALADAGVTRRLGKLDVGAANALAVKLISRASYDAAHMFDKGYQQKFDSAKATALLLLEQEGVLSQSYAPSIAALNHGSPIEEVMARAGLPRDKTRAAAHYVRWMTENGTKLFGLTEEYNRRVTALAAYDVGVELGVSDPIDYAKQMVLRTQGDYSQANRPEMFRGKLQLPYIFKAYQQNQLYLYRHVPGRVKGLLMLAAAVGLTGLPGVDDLLDLIDGVATKGRELAGYGSSRVSSRQWMREYLDAVVGGSEVLMNGLSRHLDSFADVSGSLGMGRVVPGVEPAVKGLIGSADKTAAAMRFVEELTGVAGSQGMNFLRASMDNSPDSHAFLRFLMPEALRQQKEAMDAITNKEFRDNAGNKLVPVDPHDSWGQAELLAKMMGFQSARVSRVREGKNEFNEWKRYYLTRRSLMLETVVASIINKDNPEMREAKVKALARFDEEVPNAFKLTSEEITSALEGRLTHRAREAAGFPTEDRFVRDWRRIQESFK